MRRASVRRLGWLWGALGVVGVLAAGGCDPCSGVAGCTTEPTLRVEGQLVGLEHGNPSAGVRVDMIRRGGVQLVRDSVRAVTDENGRFLLETGAVEEGEVVVDLVFRHSEDGGYRSSNHRLSTSSVRGAGNVLGRLVTPPYFAYHGELFRRLTDARVSGARVEFRRTSGPELVGPGWRSGVYSAVSDAAGRFTLFHGVWPTGSGPLVGELTVTPPNDSSYLIKGITLHSTIVENAPIQVVRLGLGTSFNWLGELYYRDTGEAAIGVEVEFRRTGGVRVRPDTFRVLTDALGAFPLMPQALAEGEVEFELSIRPPAPYESFDLPGLRMSTTDREGRLVLARWGVGSHLGYVGELHWQDTGERAADVEVEFRRTGGIEVDPDTFVVRTRPDGRFTIAPRPLEQTGEVEFQLLVRPPAPYRELSIDSLKMTTHAEDDYRLYGVWLVPLGEQP